MIFKSTRLSLSLLLPFVLLGHSCTEKEIPVSLSIELIDKGITMTHSKANDGVVEIYLISENEAEGELLVKVREFCSPIAAPSINNHHFN